MHYSTQYRQHYVLRKNVAFRRNKAPDATHAGETWGRHKRRRNHMSTASQTAGGHGAGISASIGDAWDDGAEAAADESVSLTDQMKLRLAETVTLAPNLAAGAVMLLITLMIVLLAALVGGQFAAAIPSDSPFNDAITTTTDNAGTAFVIFGVSLLAIPTVSVLAYIVVKLGPFIGFGPMMGGGGGGLMERR